MKLVHHHLVRAETRTLIVNGEGYFTWSKRTKTLTTGDMFMTYDI